MNIDSITANGFRPFATAVAALFVVALLTSQSPVSASEEDGWLFLVRVMALTLPQTTRASCKDQSTEVKARLEEALESSGVMAFSVRDLCADDLCTEARGGGALEHVSDTALQEVVDKFLRESVKPPQGQTPDEQERFCVGIVEELSTLKAKKLRRLEDVFCKDESDSSPCLGHPEPAHGPPPPPPTTAAALTGLAAVMATVPSPFSSSSACTSCHRSCKAPGGAAYGTISVNRYAARVFSAGQLVDSPCPQSSGGNPSCTECPPEDCGHDGRRTHCGLRPD